MSSREYYPLHRMAILRRIHHDELPEWQSYHNMTFVARGYIQHVHPIFGVVHPTCTSDIWSIYMPRRALVPPAAMIYRSIAKGRPSNTERELP
jgi:hypothetical protein